MKRGDGGHNLWCLPGTIVKPECFGCGIDGVFGADIPVEQRRTSTSMHVFLYLWTPCTRTPCQQARSHLGVRGHTRRCFLPLFCWRFCFSVFCLPGNASFLYLFAKWEASSLRTQFYMWMSVYSHAFWFMYKQRCEENCVKHTVDQSTSEHCVNTFCKPCLLLGFISICLSISVWVFCLLVQNQKKTH